MRTSSSTNRHTRCTSVHFELSEFGDVNFPKSSEDAYGGLQDMNYSQVSLLLTGWKEVGGFYQRRSWQGQSAKDEYKGKSLPCSKAVSGPTGTNSYVSNGNMK